MADWYSWRYSQGGNEAREADNPDFSNLDAAATALTIALKRENISHIFLGGYVASLIGGKRITEDIDVTVGKKCLKMLLKHPEFSRSTDNRLVFRVGAHRVLIDLMPERESGYSLPRSDCPDRLQVRSRDHLTRGIPTSIDILHPSVLLLIKLVPWHDSFYATRNAAALRAMTDLQDIRAILRWLVQRKERIDLSSQSNNSTNKYLRILGDLYVDIRGVRPLLADTLSVGALMATRRKYLLTCIHSSSSGPIVNFARLEPSFTYSFHRQELVFLLLPEFNVLYHIFSYFANCPPEFTFVHTTTEYQHLYYLPSPIMSVQREPADFSAHDAAATSVSLLLRNAHVPHVFQGTYAVSLIGGDRLPEGIDMIVKHDCLNLLLRHSEFRLSPDNQLVFRHKQTNIPINIKTDDDEIDVYRPPANTNKRLRVGLRSHPDRRVGTMLDILDPKALFVTRLLAWHNVCVKNRAGAHLPLGGDFEDIEVILTWLTERNERIDDQSFRFPDADAEEEFLLSLGDLYVARRQLRPHLAGLLSSSLMRIALDSVDA
ncbi:hypothetical protein N7493_011300 [Penicillium malachiteum]|uniref:Uncharacterized protein n=1 Tax=Penicillium malachiteum TaxID=1324776 RepID=A0AAD6HBV5_9EURO|nr:hypothetical protein N7493_011300 [Penicillium malachiteum]